MCVCVCCNCEWRSQRNWYMCVHSCARCIRFRIGFKLTRHDDNLFLGGDASYSIRPPSNTPLLCFLWNFVAHLCVLFSVVGHLAATIVSRSIRRTLAFCVVSVSESTMFLGTSSLIHGSGTFSCDSFVAVLFRRRPRWAMPSTMCFCPFSETLPFSVMRTVRMRHRRGARRL